MRRHSGEQKQEEAEMEEPWGQVLRFTRPTWKFALQNGAGMAVWTGWGVGNGTEMLVGELELYLLKQESPSEVLWQEVMRWEQCFVEDD